MASNIDFDKVSKDKKETNMKEMIYKENRDDSFGYEILDEGNYGGYDYVICSLDRQYPVAYVRIPEDNPLFGCKDTESIDDYLMGFADEIPCNGGITFSDEYPYCLCNINGSLKDATKLRPGWYIGWDYSHCNDFHPFIWEEGRKWTTEDVLEEVYNVIDVLNVPKASQGK